MIPRGDLRQRGGRLLVTRPSIPTAAGSRRRAQCATSSGSRAAIFYSPLGPVFDLSLCRALLFSISSLCLYYFLLHEALRFRARARRSRKALRPGLALRDAIARPGAPPVIRVFPWGPRELNCARPLGVLGCYATCRGCLSEPPVYNRFL
jgi:hypothetical protein